MFFSFSLGWGRISGQTNQAAYELQQTSLPVVDHNTCHRKNGYYVHESSMVCAGAAGSSVCNGDSGGPLVCEENGKWVLRGVTSWVTTRACPVITYSVYARVGSYVDWVKTKMGKRHMRVFVCMPSLYSKNRSKVYNYYKLLRQRQTTIK